MSSMDVARRYLQKSRQSLDGATSEYFARRFDNCANRCYYAAFHAAVAALIREGMYPTGKSWPHTFVQAQFSGVLVGRRKRIDSAHADTISRLLDLRHIADYRDDPVSETQAARAVRRATALVEAVERTWGIR